MNKKISTAGFNEPQALRRRQVINFEKYSFNLNMLKIIAFFAQIPGAKKYCKYIKNDILFIVFDPTKNLNYLRKTL